MPTKKMKHKKNGKFGIYLEMLPHQKIVGEGIGNYAIFLACALADRGWEIEIILPSYSKAAIRDLSLPNKVKINFIEVGMVRLLAAHLISFVAKNKIKLMDKESSSLPKYKKSFEEGSLLKLKIKNKLLDFLLFQPIKEFARHNAYFALFSPLAHYRHFHRLNAKKMILHLPDLLLLKPEKYSPFRKLFLSNVVENFEKSNLVAITVPSDFVIKEELLKFDELTVYKKQFKLVKHSSDMLSGLANTSRPQVQKNYEIYNKNILAKSYIYYPAQDRPTKNIREFINVFCQLEQTFPDVYLILTSGKFSKYAKNVIDLGRVSFADHSKLITFSRCTISASSYEAALPFAASESVARQTPFFCLKNPQYLEYVKSDAFFLDLTDANVLKKMCVEVQDNRATILSEQELALAENITASDFSNAYENLLS